MIIFARLEDGDDGPDQQGGSTAPLWQAAVAAEGN